MANRLVPTPEQDAVINDPQATTADVHRVTGLAWGTIAKIRRERDHKPVARRVAVIVPPHTAPKSAAEEVDREEILEQENRELRTALRKGRKNTIREERLNQAIERALENVVPIRVETAPAPPAGDGAHHRHMLVLSDFHGGEVVDRESVNGHNSYDWQIMEKRVEEVIAAVLSHKKHSPEATGLDIGFVGDQCSGVNHLELATTNQYPLAEQGVKMGYLMGNIVARLSEHYADVFAFGVVGNHPRLDKAPAAKQVFDNMDWIAYQIASEFTKNLPNVRFVVPRSGAYLHEIAGRTMYVWHADGIRSSMPGVPWGGVMRRTAEIARSYSFPIHHFVCGHFHQSAVVQGGRIIMNGSLKGTDEWVQKNFGSGDAPTQLLLVFDEKKSRLTDVKYLNPVAGL